MKISVQQYATSLYDLVHDIEKSKATEVLHSFVALLGRNRDLNLAPAIIAAFTDIWNKENGEVMAEVTSARKLDDISRGTVIQYIEKKSGAKTVVLSEKLDQKILGGFILKYNSKIVDGSLRSSLNELKGQMEA